MAATSSVMYLCGWCITGHHDQCRGPIDYEGSTWECVCTHKEEQDAPN